MKKLFMSLALVVAALQPCSAIAASRTLGSRVHGPAPGGTPYLKNVRSVPSILRNNVMSLLDSSRPRYSLIKSILYARRIAKVAKLFAYAKFVREVRSLPDVYGPIGPDEACDGKHGFHRANQKQLRARAAFLAKEMRIVFKRDIDEVKDFSKKAYKRVEEFTYKIQSIISERKPADQFEFTQKDALTYLRFIEEDGYFDEKGPKYIRVHPKTGAEEEYYVFTWVTVTTTKLAAAIVDDRFELLGRVREVNAPTVPEPKPVTVPVPAEPPQVEDDVVPEQPQSSDGADDGETGEPVEDGGDVELPDDIEIPDDIPLPDDIPA